MTEIDPIELTKVVEIRFKEYLKATPESFRERQALDELFEKIWELTPGARHQWRNKLSKLAPDRRITKGEFDEYQKRLRQEVALAYKQLPKEEEERIHTEVVAFKQFDTGVIIEQVQQDNQTVFAVYIDDNSEVTYLPELADQENEINYIPYSDELIEKSVVWLPERAEGYKSTAALLAEIRAFIHRYLEIEPIYEQLASYYVLFTWLYDCFSNLPYLRALGDTGTGKSRLLTTIGGICYKPCFIAGAITPAPIYRVIEAYQGTMVIDEADFKDSGAHSEIVKILNVGFQKDYPVIRMEPAGQSYLPRAYKVFCPKIIATRSRFKDDALENRMFTIIMRQRKRHDIPILLLPEFYEEARSLRNKLLMFRFRKLKSAKADLTLTDETLEPRLNQIFLPLASIIDEPEFLEDLNDLMRQYQREILMDRGTRWECEIVAALLELKETTLRKFFTMKEIAEVVNEHRDDDDERMTARRVGSVVRRKLFLPIERTNKGNAVFWEDNETAIKELADRYGLLEEPIK